MKVKHLSIILFLACSASFASGNNVTTSSPTLIGTDVLRFYISWNNSWRNSASPGNYDAVWIFVKRAHCSGPFTWDHTNVSSVLSDHYAGSPLEVFLDHKNAGGTDAGLFVQRATNGSGSISNVEVRVKLTGITQPGDYNFKIFAIEMVYIPAGNYYLGDGCTPSTPDRSYRSFHTYASPQTYLPYLVTGENTAIPVGTVNGRLYAEAYVPPSDIPAAYPKGHAGFYCMKYEITQGQVAEFFNHTPQVVHERWWSNGTGGRIENDAARGQVITNSTWGSVAFQHPWRAIWCNWSYGGADLRSPPIMFAILDWSGLRPMTELEYEKACRGPVYPVLKEFPWGTEFIHRAQMPAEATNLGTANESHNYTFPNPQEGIGIGLWGNLYIYRVGFAFQAGTNRIRSGASYWGVADLAGNADDGVVGTYTATALAFTANPGDGVLSPDGYADQATWPVYTSTSDMHWFSKGGLWWTDYYRSRVSSRIAWTEFWTVHFRGVR